MFYLGAEEAARQAAAQQAAADAAQQAAAVAAQQAIAQQAAAVAAQQAAAKQAAAQQWRCMDLGTANRVPVRRNAANDIECMSTNGTGCAWSSNADCLAHVTTPVSPLNPLACGAAHKALYGDGGYDIPTHWCAIANKSI